MAGRPVIGKLAVKVIPDLSTFKSDLKKALAKENPVVKVKMDLDTTGFAEKVKATTEAASKAAKVTVTTKLDTNALKNQAKAASAGLGGTIPIRLAIEAGQFAKLAIEAREEVKAIAPTMHVKVDVDSHIVELAGKKAATAFIGSVTKNTNSRGGLFSRLLGGAGSAIGSLGNALSRGLQSANRILDTMGENTEAALSSISDGFTKAQNAVSKFGSVLSNVGQVASFAAILGIILLIPAAIGGIAVALGALETALLAIPGAIAGAGIGLATLALAFHGVGDAISAGWSGDLDKFNAAMKKLTPSARQFASDVSDMHYQLSQIQKTVQENFFKPFADQVYTLGQIYLPIVKKGLGDMATVLGNAADQVAQFLLNTEAIGLIKDIFTGVNKAAKDATGAIEPLLDAFTRLANDSMPFFDSLAKDTTKAANAFDKWVKGAEKSGELGKMFDNLLLIIEEIAPLLAQFAAGIAKAFADPQTAASIKDLANALSNVLGTILTYLPDFIRAFGATAKILGPSLSTIVIVFAYIGDFVNWIVNTAAPAIMSFFRDTIPAAFGSVIDFFTSIGSAISGAAKAVGNFFTNTIPSFFSGAWDKISGFFTGLWDKISTAFDGAGTALTDPLVGFWDLIKKDFNDFVTWLQTNPVTSAIGNFIASLLNLMEAIPSGILGALGELGSQLYAWVTTNVGTPIVNFFLGLWNTVNSGIATAWSAITSALSLAWGFITTLAAIAWQGIVDTISQGWNAVTSFTSYIWGIITGFLSGIWNGLVSLLSAAWSAMSSVVVSVWTAISTFMSDVWSRIVAIARTVWNTLVSVVRSGVNGALNVLNGLSVIINRVAGWFNGLPKAASGGISSLISYVGGVPQRILNALGSLGSILYNAGRSVIQGLINGIEDMIGSLTSTLGGITNLIPDWKGPPKKDAKLLFDNGKLIMKGLVDGIRAGASDVQDTLTGFTDVIGNTTIAPAVMASIQGVAVDNSVTVVLTADGQTLSKVTAKGDKKNERRK